MKQTLLYSILFVTLFSVLSSCTKTANTTTNNVGPYNYMTATVSKGNDTLYHTWTSDLTLANSFNPNINIVGSKSSDSKTGKAGQAISFTIKNYPGFVVTLVNGKVYGNGIGTYTIDGASVTAYWSPDGITKIPAVSGTINIVNGNQESASGTFSFFCADSTMVQGTATSGNAFSVLW